MKKLNLIAAALAGIGFGLLFIGAHQHVFAIGEAIAGLSICFAALTYSLLEK